MPTVKIKTVKRRVIEGTVYEEVPGSFQARVASKAINLVQLIDEGIPPIQYLPASDEMLRCGKRHYIAAPAKEGKSIAMLAHCVDMVVAGAKVVVLDRENGQDTYAERLADIMRARRLTDKQRKQVGEQLSYFEFPQLKSSDAEDLVELFAAADLVVFDSQRMFLSDLGFSEEASDDYARFMAYIIDPLFRARIATLMLDNTGHKEKTRARGTSSKGDLNEIIFYIEIVTPFSTTKRGELKLVVDRSRSGNSGEWRMRIGGGYFYPWEPFNIDLNPRSDFREAVEEVLADGKPRGQDKLMEAVRHRGVRLKTPTARHLLDEYVKDPSVSITHSNKGYSCASK
jgi:hypothetical protein